MPLPTWCQVCEHHDHTFRTATAFTGRVRRFYRFCCRGSTVYRRAAGAECSSAARTCNGRDIRPDRRVSIQPGNASHTIPPSALSSSPILHREGRLVGYDSVSRQRVPMGAASRTETQGSPVCNRPEISAPYRKQWRRSYTARRRHERARNQCAYHAGRADRPHARARCHARRQDAACGNSD